MICIPLTLNVKMSKKDVEMYMFMRIEENYYAAKEKLMKYQRGNNK